MKVQIKILLLLVGMAAIFIGSLAALKVIERRHFRSIAERRANERNTIFDQFLKERGDNLTIFVEDSTVWDDMVRAVMKSDVPWVEQHLTDESLTTFHANAVWVYRPDGVLLFSRNNRYAENLRELPIPRESIAQALGKERVCHFFCKVPQGWMEIRGATIHPSRDRFRETTPQGYFFAGHVWIDESIKRMAMFTGYSIRIVPAEEMTAPALSAEEQGLISFSRVLPGWDGRPIAQIQVQHDSPIIRELNRSSERLFYCLIAFALALVLVLSISLIRWVRRPLRLISGSLEDGTPAGLRRLERERNEFGRLSQLILKSRATESELHRTEELLQHAQKLEAVGRLAGGVAHDFNNLLTAIIGYAELLELKLQHEPTSREQAALIRRAGEQAASLTRQLLAFSRKQLLQPVVLDLNAHLCGMEKLLHRVIGEHIRIRIEPLASDSRVLADPTQIEQVVLNLGVNARDAMPHGGTLTITTTLKQRSECMDVDGDEFPAGDYVELCVSDTGAGMDTETQARIFEPFFTTKGPGKGTGLGLATVYGIIKQTGGGISVRSEPGQGTTFCLHLPLEKAPLTYVCEAPPHVGLPAHGETILVLEDEEVVRDLVCAVLRDVGYEVLCAGTPQEAIEKARAHSGRIDLLVSDVILPEMHGPAAARILCKLKPEMRVLFVSGYSENDISDQGVLDAEVEILQKPFTQQSLARKIREMLDEAAPADARRPAPAPAR